MGNNNGFGAFFIVLLLVVVTLSAGFLFNDNGYLMEDKEIADAVSVEAITKLTATEKNVQAKEAELQQAIAAREAAEAELSDARARQKQAEAERDAALTAKQSADNTIMTLQAQLNEARLRNAEIIAQNNQQQPQAQAQSDTGSQKANTLPWTSNLTSTGLLVLIGGALCTIVVVVIVSFRAIPPYDDEPRNNTRQAVEGETVYVRMTREEASKYAHDRNRSTQPGGDKQSSPIKRPAGYFDPNVQRDAGKGYQGEQIKGRQS